MMRAECCGAVHGAFRHAGKADLRCRAKPVRDSLHYIQGVSLMVPGDAFPFASSALRL
jgi:hypothetical protein